MNYITHNNYTIPYKIAKKNNKNTYFYFKRDGYIQINLSRHQTEKDALKYIRQNIHIFAHRLEKNRVIPSLNPKMFHVFGIEYDYEITNTSTVVFNSEINAYLLPTTDTKSEEVKLFYKRTMLTYLEELSKKYESNGYVDISDIKLQTRYTKTRHGSCNARLRKININLHLVQYDKVYTEYVFLHEIAHLKHQNHSKDFYSLLEKLLPNYKKVRQELKEIYR